MFKYWIYIKIEPLNIHFFMMGTFEYIIVHMFECLNTQYFDVQVHLNVSI